MPFATPAFETKFGLLELPEKSLLVWIATMAISAANEITANMIITDFFLESLNWEYHSF